LKEVLGGKVFIELPTVFWLSSADGVMHALCLLGLALSLMAMAGFANAWTMAIIWVLYSSFVRVGQIFYGYGWELMMLEAGFLAIFLAPTRAPGSPKRRLRGRCVGSFGGSARRCLGVGLHAPRRSVSFL
jgi:hypothetical protein